MALLWPLLAGVGGLIAGSMFGNTKKKDEPRIHTEPALHPMQEQIIGEMTPVISNILKEQQSGSYLVDALGRAGTRFDQTVRDPMMGQLREDIIPGIEQQYAGPGTFWGSDRAKATTKAGQDMANYLTSARADYMGQAEQQANAMQIERMNQALRFMGLPTTASVQIPQQQSFLSQALSLSPEILAVLLQYGII